MLRSFIPRAARAALALSLLTLLSVCAPPPEEVPSADVERAQQALAPFKEQLFGALTDSLAEGPASSIHVCREKAPEIAAALSVDGVEMGRTSHRLRNPANAPAPWVEPLLAAYVEDADLAEPRAVRLEDGQFGYVEPIRAIHVCVSCHGPSIDPELLAEIRTLYPEDRATGFRVGDLRGLFWVTMPSADG